MKTKPDLIDLNSFFLKLYKFLPNRVKTAIKAEILKKVLKNESPSSKFIVANWVNLKSKIPAHYENAIRKIVIKHYSIFRTELLTADKNIFQSH